MEPENVVKATVFLADMADFRADERGLREVPREGAARPLDDAGRARCPRARKWRST